MPGNRRDGKYFQHFPRMDGHDTRAEGYLRTVGNPDTVTDTAVHIKTFGYGDTGLDIDSHASGFALEAADERIATAADAGNVICEPETGATMRREGNLARRRSVAHGDSSENSAKLLGNVLFVYQYILSIYFFLLLHHILLLNC